MTRSLCALVLLLGAVAARAAPGRILVLLAHPDDEVLMAGTLVRAVEQGWKVRAAYATSGDAGHDVSGRGLSGAGLAEVRERETRLSNRALGFAGPPSFLRFPDGKAFDEVDPIARGFAAIAGEWDPDLIMTLGPNGITGHKDHMAVFLAARHVFEERDRRPGFLAAVFTRRRASLFGREWGLRGVAPASVDVRVCVPPRIGAKRVTVLRVHRTQFPGAMVRSYRRDTLVRDRVEEFQGDGRIPGVTTGECP